MSLLQGLKYSLAIICFISSVFWVSERYPYGRDFLPTLFVILGVLAIVISVGLEFYRSGYRLSYDWALDRFSILTLVDSDRGNPINAAVLLGLSMLGALWLLESRSAGAVFLLLAVALLFLFFVLLTKSRGPLLSLLIVVLLYLVLCRRNKWVLVAVVSVAALLLFSPLLDAVLARFAEENYRLEIWAASLRLIEDDYWFGLGLNYNAANIPVYHAGPEITHSHSFLIDCLRIGGVVGLLLMLYILCRVIPAGLMSEKHNVRFCAFWLLFGCGCLMSNGQLLVYRPSISWLAFWLPLSLLCYFQLSESRVKR